MSLPLPTHVHTNPNWGINDSIAKFLVIKSPYYYFSASTNYFDRLVCRSVYLSVCVAVSLSRCLRQAGLHVHREIDPLASIVIG